MKTMSWDAQSWKNENTWKGFVDGSLCPMCEEHIYEQENNFSFKIVELDSCIVRLAKNQYYYGWVIIILKNHAVELHDLSAEELSQYWSDVAKVSKALQNTHDAAKINYCIFGNHVPHIHCHLFPRHFDHDPSVPIKMDAEERYLSLVEYKKMITDLRLQIELK